MSSTATVRNIIKRSEFLSALENVQSGISKRGSVAQSTSFVFTKGEIVTFDGEVCCRTPNPVGDIVNGAVNAEKLWEILDRLREEDLTIEMDKSHLILHGHGRKAGIVMDKEVVLPVDGIETPDQWHAIPERFLEAIETVRQCAGNNETKIATVLVHIHPQWLEAGDVTQICRWKMPTGFGESCCVRHTSAKHLAKMEVEEFSETSNWIHFKKENTIISCRRYLQSYPDFTEIYNLQGTPSTLPKELTEESYNAQVFSKENDSDGRILVELRKGLMRVSSQGIYGFYKGRPRKIDYAGNSISFMIAPDLLNKLVLNQDHCEIGSGKLKIVSNDCIYIACLFQSKTGKINENE